MQKMTIHRALAELKLIDARIEKGIVELYPTSISQKGKKIDGHLTVEEFTAKATAGYDSVKDLINRKVEIKSAIVKSNGVTKVKIGELEMTVSDAITFRSVVEFKKKFAGALKQKHAQAVAIMNKNNEAVTKNSEILLQQAYGKDSTKVSKEDYDSVATPFLENNSFSLVDPIKAAEKVEALEKEISTFEAEVDAVLSESNATTFIEIG